MKKLLLALLLIPSLAFADDVQLARLSPAMVGGGVPAAASYPDIDFYWSMNNTTTAEKSSGDSSAEHVGGEDFTNSPTGPVGAYWGRSNGIYDQFDFVISSADIADHLSGRIGFYVRFTTAFDAGTELFKVWYGESDYIRLVEYEDGATSRVRLIYVTGGTGAGIISTTSFVVDTTYFIECSWVKTGTNVAAVIYVNGVSDQTGNITVAESWAATPTLLRVMNGNADGAGTYLMQQFFSSSDETRDLNALKGGTSFPD